MTGRRLPQCVECGACVHREAVAKNETKCEIHRDWKPGELESLEPFARWLDGLLDGSILYRPSNREEAA